MAQAKANGIQIEYETFGDPSGRPLLLIIGFSGQMIWWDDDLCENLAERGHYVIRFDNRDAGLSTKFSAHDSRKFKEIFVSLMSGEKVGIPYTLDDMADDAVGLLDALGIRRAHICGMSMGGMIAQTIAIRHPSRVVSLTSIYSTTGNPELPKPEPAVMQVLVTYPPREREAYVEYELRVHKILSGPGFPLDDPWVRKVMARSYDRCFYPEGTGRQLLAILTQVDRRTALALVKTPTLVIHGTDDPLIPVEGGKDTARAIPGSVLVLIEGMGHDIPHGGAWPRIVEAVTAHTRKAVACSPWIQPGETPG